MEREQELRRLLSVLHRMARTAARVQWTGVGESEARYGVSQYNRILLRLIELEPAAGPVFEPLPPDATLLVVAMAARQTVSYFEDELRTEPKQWDWSQPNFAFGKGCSTQFNFEELGNWVRDRMAEFQRSEKEKRAEGKPTG